MKKFVLAAAAAVLVPAFAVPALAADAPAAAPTVLSTADTKLGDLLDNPAAKAILTKYISEMISNPQIDQARGMTLKQLQGYAADALPDLTLAKIDAELAKLPAK
ncbi:MAG: hypothetical protein JF593_05500 [Novosphingobium sp.]|nr:hypothetical protein [Novosphingobium sp.]